jgi:predicted nucleic acid-binding protein
MIYGIDTGFLVSVEHAEHPDRAAACTTLSRLLADGDRLAVAPQVIAEFIHVVTDPHRFRQPAGASSARLAARNWWTARQVDHVFPDEETVRQFLDRLDRLKLGRKRLLDTLLAATYHRAGIRSLLTTNPDDFRAFDCFDLITPSSMIARP